jgi:hypothetical protein
VSVTRFTDRPLLLSIAPLPWLISFSLGDNHAFLCRVNSDHSITLRLGVQRALCGQVPASLREVSVAATDRRVRFRCYFGADARFRT